ncbi:phosphinothricin acetyltransferase|nr:phosphinothricin acetyltransferase [Candidatus Pantoea persica]
MHIIPATAAHMPAVQQIYAWHVLHGSATFETEPPEVEEMQQRLRALLDKGGIWLVALEADRVIGYGLSYPPIVRATPTALRWRIPSIFIQSIPAAARAARWDSARRA